MGVAAHISWRKLGDVISSLFALGYHERVEHRTPVPTFLKHLRQAAFARVYSADKNVSIFFGRPPRIHRKYCHIDLLRYRAEFAPGLGELIGKQYRQRSFNGFDYTADTQWSASCAVLKEEILDLYKEENCDERIRKSALVSYILFRYSHLLIETGSHRPRQRHYGPSSRRNSALRATSNRTTGNRLNWISWLAPA